VNVRRFLWSLLIAAGATMLLMLWLKRQQGGPRPAERRPATRPAATRPAATGPATTATAPAPAEARWGNPIYPVHERMLGSLDTESGYQMRLQLTSRGAAVRTLKLTEHFATVDDKRRHREDPETYEQAVYRDPDLQGHYSLLNPVGVGPKKTYPLATRRVRFASHGVRVNLDGPRWAAGPVTTDTGGTQSVTFSSEITRNGAPFVRLEKTYRLAKGSYSAEVRLRVVNRTSQPIEFDLLQFAATGVPREDLRSDQRVVAYGRWENGQVKVSTPAIGKVQDWATGLAADEKHTLGRSDVGEPVLWAGQANRFFAVLAYVRPASEQEPTPAAPGARAEFFQAVLQETPTWKTQLAGVRSGAHELPAGGRFDLALDVFAGPKERDLLDGKPPHGKPLYATLEYKKAIQFGSCGWCSWPWLSLAMMWLLGLFSNITFGNYGLAIILLVVLVRLVLHPLTKKGQVAMMGMQKLQPRMQEIREKYKNDKAKLNEEMMKLYKSAGGTPLLGCLPMLLQMPIWIALWTGLNASVELRHAAFLPVWITDLAAPDALIHFGGKGFQLPLIGGMTGPIASLNLLPILLTVAMFLQQKFTPQAAATGQQAQTQKQMMYIMPVFLLLIFYNAASGLTMYIMASTFAGVAEQYIIRKHIRELEAEQAATETRVSMPGKRFRGQKPKKPKGPFRTTR